MFTKSALTKAKIDLYNITANHAKQDYLQANFKNGKRKSKKHIPYSLSDDTNAAREVYNIVFGKNPEDITQNQEEQIKGFLLVYRLHRTEFLENVGGKEYYSA